MSFAGRRFELRALAVTAVLGASVLDLGCAMLAGIDEYRVDDAAGRDAAPPSCPTSIEVRNAEGVCEPAGVTSCPGGFGSDLLGGCSYRRVR